MDHMPLPRGAEDILLLRNIGKRPADMVLVSLIGPLSELNPVVVAKPGATYDWRFLIGVDVLVVADSNTEPLAVHKLLAQLMALPTEYLGLWLADLQDGVHVAHGTCRHRCPATQTLLKDERAQWAGLGLPRKEIVCG